MPVGGILSLRSAWPKEHFLSCDSHGQIAPVHFDHSKRRVKKQRAFRHLWVGRHFSTA
jgi:ribosomal protein L20